MRKKGVRGKSKKAGKEMKLIVEAVKMDESGYYSILYKIDMEKGQVTRIPHTLRGDNGLSNMVSLGSVLFLLGADSRVVDDEGKGKEKGACLYHKGLSYIDLKDDDNDQGWMEAPFVSDPPFVLPCVVALHGKIYLFSSTTQGYSRYLPGVFVFDPVSDNWQTLILPPDLPPFAISYPVLADPDNSRLLVCFATLSSIYAFYPASSRWELITTDVIGWHSKVTFAHGILFYNIPCSPTLLAAYHFASKQRLNLVFTSKVPAEFWRYEFDFMFYSGNNHICFSSYSTKGDKTYIYIAKLRFEYSPGSAVLLITPLSFKTYTLDIFCCIRNYFPVQL